MAILHRTGVDGGDPCPPKRRWLSARHHPQGQDEVLALRKRLLRLKLLLTVLGGIVGVYVFGNLIEGTESPNTWFVLMRDISIGLLVSATVIIAIEMYAAEGLLRRIALNVIEATFESIVHKPIMDQVTQHVIQSQTYRANWEIGIRLVDRKKDRELYAGLKQKPGCEDVWIAEFSIDYDCYNPNPGEVSTVVRGGIDLDISVPDAGLPRFTSITPPYGDRRSARPAVRITEKQAAAMLGAKNSPPSGEETLAADTGISLAVEKETRVVFSTTATIPGKSSVHVAFEYLRLLRPPDIVLVSASQATVGLKLKVLSDPLRCEVVALHPDSGALVSVGNEWTFSPAFLPWQGFQIKILPPSSAATT